MTYPNWFGATGAQTNFERHLAQFKGKPVQFLQIGAFTGDASVWMLENILTHAHATLTDVDTWRGSDENSHHAMDFEDVYSVYTDKTKRYENVHVFRETSDSFFESNNMNYDFVYIDGDHTAFGVMRDGMNAFDCLNVGGIIAFDDYHWSEGRGNFYEPRPAVDAFFNITRDKIKVIEIGWQVWIQKEFV
jgi:predicted O-methyltransferase YrrM